MTFASTSFRMMVDLGAKIPWDRCAPGGLINENKKIKILV